MIHNTHNQATLIGGWWEYFWNTGKTKKFRLIQLDLALIKLN